LFSDTLVCLGCLGALGGGVVCSIPRSGFFWGDLPTEGLFRGKWFGIPDSGAGYQRSTVSCCAVDGQLAEIRFGKSPDIVWRNDVKLGDQGRLLLDGSEASVNLASGAASAHRENQF